MIQRVVCQKLAPVLILSGLLLFPACGSGYRIAETEGGRVEMTSAYDKTPDREALDILLPYKAKVDSVMKPVIGKSSMPMKPERPESLLSNLIADVLRESSLKYTGETAEVAIINIGGLRNDLPKGNVTYGDVFEILPFENSLCILTMDGKALEQLFWEIANVKGEGLSGAELKISPDGKLINALVHGEAIDQNRKYRVATVDYLSEGNDGMTAFMQATEKVCPDGATVRQLFLDYIIGLTKKGKEVTSGLDGRIRIEK